MQPTVSQATFALTTRPTAAPAPAAPALPGYQLERRLPPHRLGPRSTARQGRDVYIVCHVERLPAGIDFDDAQEALRPACAFRHAHAAGLCGLRRDAGGRAGLWLIAPHCGTREGLLTLADLLTTKDGGEFDELEAVVAVRSLLEALSAARACGAPHGPLRIDEILVHRHGRLVIDLLGVERALHRSVVDGPGDARAEARSIVAIACELLTGVTPLDPRDTTPLRSLGRAWRLWLARGLEAGAGFSSVEEALAVLPDPLHAARRRRPRIFR